jgi:hypothetical protein
MIFINTPHAVVDVLLIVYHFKGVKSSSVACKSPLFLPLFPSAGEDRGKTGQEDLKNVLPEFILSKQSTKHSGPLPPFSTEKEEFFRCKRVDKRTLFCYIKYKYTQEYKGNNEIS